MERRIEEETVFGRSYSCYDDMHMTILPFSRDEILALTQKFPTPFYVYDEVQIRAGARDLFAAFQSAGLNFQNFFAVKALPNPFVLKLLHEEGMGTDCSSLAELLLAERAGITGEQIFLTSNNTPEELFAKGLELGAIINFDDIGHLDFFLDAFHKLPDVGCVRFNPGGSKDGNVIIGNPKDAKFGMTREQAIEAYRKMKDAGVKRFGIHTMVASNCLEPEYFLDTAKMIFTLMIEIRDAVGIEFEFVNLGGGFGIPYKPEQNSLDISLIAKGIKDLHNSILIANNHPSPKIFMENGRFITGPHGYLITKVQHLKKTYKQYVGVDASMANLMRPGMYGAYHHISILGKELEPAVETYDVVGGLCENNDKFAIDRKLPHVEVGDLLVIHDAGAHGHAMGFRYNGHLGSAEFLRETSGTYKMIRRAETIEDYFATLIPQG